MNLKSCAVIGHRPTRFKFGYKEKMTGCKRLKKRLRDQFAALYEQGVRRFYVGGCLGADQWSGEILLRLKEQPEYSGIELAVVMPFPNHDAKWDERNRNRLQFLLSHSVEQIVTGTDNQHNSFLARNRYMIDHADVLMAIYDNDRTVHNSIGQAVVYAEKKHLPVIFIHPDTGIISVRGEKPEQSNQFIHLSL